MTREEIDILLSEPVRAAIEANLDNDPIRIALDKHIQHAGLVATQVKYLQRARAKLPSYYEVRCVIPPLAFEQSSSELAASYKNYSGDLCIDLTCGLGVDAFALSKRFGQVITLERNPELAYLAERNFGLLGAHNIRVVNMPAEEFLASPDAPHADLIYADPDRRSDSGRKLVRLEDCEPDITALLPRLRELADRVVVKMSPLFDVGEAFRVFGGHTRVEVVSLDGECKEVVAETGGGIPHPLIAATVIGFGTVEYLAGQPEAGRQESPKTGQPAETGQPETGQQDSAEAGLSNTGQQPPGDYEYLIIPDVALAKARIARRYFADKGCYIESDNSYAFAASLPDAPLPGKAYRITVAAPYSPKKLKKELSARGIKRIDILKHDFPLPAGDIARQLGVREGGSVKIAFTRVGGNMVAMFVEAL